MVPVGLSAHREGLTKLDPVTPAIAAAIDLVGVWRRAAASWPTRPSSTSATSSTC
ncbi:MAG: hypothetical protein IPH09_13200 [bacterium]|nr:hypothetical protein [bacterium]